MLADLVTPMGTLVRRIVGGFDDFDEAGGSSGVFGASGFGHTNGDFGSKDSRRV